jgi:cytochrome c-type biogenesis protein CcmH/NrfG
MRRILISLFLAGLAVLSIGCGYGGVESADATPVENVNSAENTTVETEKDVTEIPVEEMTSAETALEAGNIFFDRNQNEKAIEAYKQAAKLDPDLAEAHFKLGIAYAIKESQEELNPVAVDESDSSKKNKNKKPNSEVAFENAVTAYKKLIKKNKEDAEAYFNLGRSYNKLNDDKEAKKALEQAVKLEPEKSLYQTEYGAILIKFAKYDLAIRALNKALEIDEANSLATELLVQAKAGKKRVDFGAEKLRETSKRNTPSEEEVAPRKSSKRSSSKEEDKPAEAKEETKKNDSKKDPAKE